MAKKESKIEGIKSTLKQSQATFNKQTAEVNTFAAGHVTNSSKITNDHKDEP